MLDTESKSSVLTTEAHDLSLGAAKLGGTVGEGVIRVRRDLNGSVFEILGTWRLAPEGTLPSVLQRAQDEGTPVTYDGPLVDPGEPTRKRISMDVVLNGIHEYRRHTDGAARSEHVTLVHLKIESLPYPATVAKFEVAIEVATHGRGSRYTVPVFEAATERGLPPFVATLDGVRGGSWDIGGGAFSWYTTPAETGLPFLDLYQRVESMKVAGPVELTLQHPSPRPDAGGDTAEQGPDVGRPAATGTRKVKQGASVNAPAGAPARRSGPETSTVKVDAVGRSEDASYIIASGTVA